MFNKKNLPLPHTRIHCIKAKADHVKGGTGLLLA
ncbi:hypothetical protein AYI69_g9254, partial [Smittium culicis]